MKQLSKHITEALKINSKSKVNTITYHYHPKDADELYDLIRKLIKERGNKADLNDIDTSQIIEMTELFYNLKNFDGDISKWDVSNVEDMSNMFEETKFSGKNGDISNWNVKKLKYAIYMFRNSEFNCDISNWSISDDCQTLKMFKGCPLEKNPPKWYHE